jgi:hypothetical protein
MIIRVVNSVGAIIYITLCLPIIFIDVLRIYIRRYKGLTDYDELGMFNDSNAADYNIVLYRRKCMLDQAKRAREHQKYIKEERARVESHYTKRFDELLDSSMVK